MTPSESLWGAHDIAILWSRLDRMGAEGARIRRLGDDWLLEGSAVFEHEGRGCRLDYHIVCDGEWRTKSASVDGWVGDNDVRVRIVAENGRWLLNDRVVDAVEGCIDVDLNFSPSTNVLPIRRLQLAVGEEAEVRAAWLRFPSFTLEPLDQKYRRTGERTMHYESAGGSFAAELEIDEHGLVTHYPGFARISR